MQKFKVEKDFMIGDYRCVILGLSLGHRCGYIGLPKGSKYENMGYDEIDISVHGGLTYAGDGVGYPVQDERSWIGFDCAHSGDGKDFELIKELSDERTYNIMVDMERRFNTGGEVRTTEYVENELVDLVKQLNNNTNEIVDENDLRNKKLPFPAIVSGNYLDCYNWEDGDKLQIIELVDDLNAEHNEYLWKAINFDRENEIGGVATYQISF